MSEWIRLCSLDEIPALSVRGFVLNLDRTKGKSHRISVAVARVTGENITVFEDRCPHKGAKLSSGTVFPGYLQCAQHGWRIDLQTGSGTPAQMGLFADLPTMGTSARGVSLNLQGSSIGNRIGSRISAELLAQHGFTAESHSTGGPARTKATAVDRGSSNCALMFEHRLEGGSIFILVKSLTF
jgi:nitrite reductase/ring-hydroxylating ferredoxin subunit